MDPKWSMKGLKSEGEDVGLNKRERGERRGSRLEVSEAGGMG